VITEAPESRYIDVIIKAITLSLFYTLPGTSDEKYIKIEKVVKIKKKTLKKIRKKTKERDYNFEMNKLHIHSYHINDAPRYGRIFIFSNPDAQQQIIKIVTKDRNGREKLTKIITKELIPKVSR